MPSSIHFQNKRCIATFQDVKAVDELQIVIRGPTSQKYRNRYIINYYIRNPNIAITELFQSTNVNVLKKLARFIAQINRILR